MISAVPNIPIATTTKPMPSESSGMPKVKRSTPELTSVPTRPSSRPNTTMAIALTSEPRASTVAAIRPNTISEKYSDGPNFSATSASGGAATAMIRVATQPAKNEPIAAIASAGPALTRHLVAGDTGDHRRGLAGDVDQDGRGRAAVLRAVVDAGEHDERRDRVQVERDRQQHRDGGDRADAGKHSDQRAEQHADERVQQVERADRYAEAEDEVVEEIHARLSRTRMRPGTSGKAASGPSRRPGTRRGSG